MEKSVVILLMLLMVPFAAAECVEPYDGMVITEDTDFCGKTYDVPNGITIGADDILLNCKTSILRGDGTGIGILLESRKGVEIRECTVITHDIGIFMKDSIGNTVVDNGILKNRIGVRLLNSYENLIGDNNDKSFVKAVSSVNSKFNVYDYGNKNIDDDFCDYNTCNLDEEVKPCVDDDFYCSDKCTANTDNDCRASIVEKKTEPPAEEKQEPAPAPKEKIQLPESKAPVKPPRYWLYPLFYLLTFLIIEFVAYVKRFDREGG